jgi:polar amino acid transport system substrate-binding protein
MKIITIFLCTVLTIYAASPAHGVEKLVFSAIQGSTTTVISKKVVDEMYRRMGIEISAAYYPGKRALIFANEGKTDGELQRIAGMDQKFPNLLMIPVPVNILEGMVFTKETEFTVNGWESLRPYRIGIRRGIIFSDKGCAGMNTTVVNTNEQLFEILDQGLVDIIVITRLNGLDVAGRLKIPGIRALEPPIETYPLYHYLHVKNKHLAPKLTSVLQAMEKEGVIRHIRKQFMDELKGE